MSGVGILLVLSLSGCFLGTWGEMWEWGPDLEGPWCAKRRGQQCCIDRDDYCSVPILGTECYCDVFCNATAYDCCPDYWEHCHGVVREERTTPLPIIYTTPRIPVTTNNCRKNGVLFQPGQKLKENCNECMCEVFAGPPRRFDWRCSQNVCLIRPELIRAVNDGRYGWTASNHSVLWGMTLPDGVKYRLGTFPLDSNVVRMTPLKVRLDEVLPEAFDSRQKWGQLINPIRDQGNCGASWAFSTTAVASDRLGIEFMGDYKEQLSPQHILSCNSDKQEGCAGGNLDRAWYYLRRRGLVTEDCYPYSSGRTSTVGECLVAPRKRQGDCPSGIEFRMEKRYKTTPPYRIRPLEREIMKEIMVNGPVQATFIVKEDFYMYKDGIYRYSNISRGQTSNFRRTGYHSVRMLGWGVERTFRGDIVKYWLCANSWGTDWGENGFFRIVRGENECEIEAYIVGAFGKDNRRRRLINLRRLSRIRDGRKFRSLNLRRRRRRRKNKKNKNKDNRRKFKKSHKSVKKV
ncbi:uncharacterized peptidase C1-like protein F26E4.3 [Haliotis cracherodii]|uniref:uncharacterized peptidase C1-like protein F26E4.3 n=1 Tax=Haliotis cracherodii TaxID=6455 RepID=UPI0039ECFF0E